MRAVSLCLLVLSQWPGGFDAGTAGLTRHFREFHSAAWRSAASAKQREHAAPQTADHVCIDMNFILHSCYRLAEEPRHVIAKIFASIDDVLRCVSPSQSLVLAFDGPAPFAKLQTQRSRRKSAIKNCLLTPGTDFMNSMENLMLCYALQRIRFKLRNISVYISGPSYPGEGELKILEWIYTTSPPKNESVMICGCDSDILLQTISLDQYNCSVLQYGTEFSDSICDANTLFDSIVNTTIQYSKNCGIEVAAITDGSSLMHECCSRPDMLLLYLLQGNDYLPKLRAITIHKATRTYAQTMLKLPPNERFLYNASGESFNIEALLLFFRGLGTQGGVALPLQAPGAVQTLHNVLQRRKEVLKWTEEEASNGTDGRSGWSGKLQALNRVYESSSLFPSKRELRKNLALIALEDIDKEAYDAMWERQADARRGLEEMREHVRRDSFLGGVDLLDGEAAEESGFDFDTEDEYVVSEEEYMKYVRENDAMDYLRGLLWIMKMYRSGVCPDLSFTYAGKPALTAFALSRFLERAVSQHGLSSLASMLRSFNSNYRYTA